MTTVSTADGIPVAAATDPPDATYENSQPHTRVMGIMLVYLAPDR
jgi:hypothetical protein